MDEDSNDLIKQLHELLTSANWPNLSVDSKGLFTTIEGEKFYFVKISNSKYIVSFSRYLAQPDTYEVFGGMQIVFDVDLPFHNFIYLGSPRNQQPYGLHRSGLVRGILQTYSGKYAGTSELNISSNYSRLSFSPRTKVLKVPYKKYIEILEEVENIKRITKSYHTSVERHLINEASKKHIGVKIGRVTNISSGEFSFVVHRLNIDTKNNKKDFMRYMNTSDVSSLQDLTMALIDKEVFELSYLRKLDSYFLKEKLQDIVSIGRSIIDLGSTDLSTTKAKRVIQRLYKDEENVPRVKQLETLWQKYFEKYLLYLIFTYKQIYPKIKLTLNGDKKYPDFLGVNHYNGVDVIEIKTHLLPALVSDSSHDNFAFSSDLSKAIIQTTNYIDAVKERKFVNTNDERLLVQETEAENLYRPRGVIIVSSKQKLVKSQWKYDPQKIERDFTKLRNSLGYIEILTFDDILDIAENYALKIANRAEPNSD